MPTTSSIAVHHSRGVSSTLLCGALSGSGQGERHKPDRLLETAQRAYNDGDFRWVAKLVGHLVFADPSHAQARELQAAAFEQLAFGAENGTWRNFFLTGALELRGGSSGTPTVSASPDVLAALSVPQLFDSMTIRVDGPRAWDLRLTIDWTFNDTGEQYRTSIVNGCSPTAPARAATQPTR
jgi:alkyl sulfatase BDS1-like metallo-beta-lactamase superfamily hydrolase